MTAGHNGQMTTLSSCNVHQVPAVRTDKLSSVSTHACWQTPGTRFSGVVGSAATYVLVYVSRVRVLPLAVKNQARHHLR